MPQALPKTTARFHKKREAIVVAAAAQFNLQGIKGTTLTDIAVSVGLANTSITYYYRRKEDLAMECIMRAIAVHVDLATQAARGHTVEARVTRLFTLLAQMLAENDSGERPPLIYFNDIRALPKVHSAIAFAAYNDMFRSVRRLLTAPSSSTHPLQLSRPEANARTHLLLSAAHWMRAWIGRHEIDEYTRMAEHLADLLLHGLAGTRSTWQAAAGLHADALADPASARNPNGEAFLRAASELVNAEGYRGASVHKISTRINLTKGSFYDEHESKIDLVSACFERTFSLLRAALISAERPTGPGWQRICTVTTQLVQFQVSERGPMLRTSAHLALPDEAHRQSARLTYQRLIERIASVLVDGMIDHSVRPCNPAIAAQLLASGIDAAAELRRWVPTASADTVEALYARPALLGLLCN